MKNKNTGFLISTIAFCIVVLVALPLRTYQFLAGVLEPGTGFFSGEHWSVYALYFAVAAGLVISIAAALIYKKELGFDRSVEKRPGQGILSLVAAISVLFETALSVNSLIGMFASQSVDTPASPLLVTGAQCIFGIFTAIYFVVFGLSVISGSSNASEYKILSISPVVWCMFRLVYRFTRTISFIKVSDLLFELFMLSFMLMFFMAFSQLNSKIESKGLDWKLVGYGLPAATLALICFVPRFIVLLSGNQEMLYEHSNVEYCDIGIALFILSVVFTRIGWTGGNADAREEALTKESEE